ncbi:MAG: tryptophan transporter [Clostridium butyricum]|nr:tryptophan transporter [Clostridium butyricum]
MDTKRMVTNGILIAIGAILHQITPGIEMQPDLSLAMLFIIMVYNKDYKTSLICGIAVGIFAAVTSKTPNGQLPNIIDKFITCNVIYFVLLPLRNKVSKTVQILTALPLGTILSGTIFLFVLMMLNGFPMETFKTLFVSVVLTTAALNVVLGFALFKVVGKTIKITGAYSIEDSVVK